MLVNLTLGMLYTRVDNSNPYLLLLYSIVRMFSVYRHVKKYYLLEGKGMGEERERETERERVTMNIQW